MFAHLFLNKYFFVPPEYSSWGQQQAEAPRPHRAVWRDVIYSAENAAKQDTATSFCIHVERPHLWEISPYTFQLSICLKLCFSNWTVLHPAIPIRFFFFAPLTAFDQSVIYTFQMCFLFSSFH